MEVVLWVLYPLVCLALFAVGSWRVYAGVGEGSPLLFVSGLGYCGVAAVAYLSYLEALSAY